MSKIHLSVGFDRTKCRQYHAALMSRNLDTWYSLPDLEHLARLGKAVEVELDPGKLTRLAGLLSGSAGAVNASMMAVARSDGIVEVQLKCAAEVELTCQRCLEPMRYRLAGAVSYEVVDEGSEERNDGGQESIERLVLHGRRLNPLELIEEELIVSVPLSPRHDDEAACGSLARRIEELNTQGGDDQADVSANH
jgi:uncharacterized protein